VLALGAALARAGDPIPAPAAAQPLEAQVVGP